MQTDSTTTAQPTTNLLTDEELDAQFVASLAPDSSDMLDQLTADDIF